MTTLPNVIVPESTLDEKRAAITSAVTRYAQDFNVDPLDPHYGSAFTRYLFFSHCKSAGTILDMGLDDRSRFYNAYYWFQRFVKLRTNHLGHDAGLEQQAFQLLEHAAFELDLGLVDSLDEAAFAS